MGTSHRFDHRGLTYSWSVSSLSVSMSTLYFKEAGDNLLAWWEKRPDGIMDSGLSGGVGADFRGGCAAPEHRYGYGHLDGSGINRILGQLQEGLFDGGG
ncbi:hypothetical protein CSHISOI_03370 [Colletotrichum shisoi]|uniref:Uncharacterized protein n=1 Tax=Colletotrichum shisoi TaxID=2078593 RepID=A0A5Q4BYG0_9PEZI|nr:hypothetical protein CSHISOI_03370 [Colletotrichum shisoi]